MTHFMDSDDLPETLAERVLRLHENVKKAEAHLDAALEDLAAEEALERLRAEEYLGERTPLLPNDAPPDTAEARRDRYVSARRWREDSQARANRHADELSDAQDAFMEAALELAKDAAKFDEQASERVAQIEATVLDLNQAIQGLQFSLNVAGEISTSDYWGIFETNKTLRRLDEVIRQIGKSASEVRRISE